MTKQAPYAVIFDMDGVLIDSVRANLDAAAEAYLAFGVTLPDGDLLEHRGKSLRDLHQHFRDELGHEIAYPDYETEYNQTLDRKRDQLLARGPNPALVALVTAVHAAGWQIGVGSLNIRRNCETILRRLGIRDHFSAIVTCEDTDAHKPEPDVFLLTAERLGVDPARCAVIEDAENGVEAAHRAGMVAVGFAGFLRNSNEPLLPHADLVISSFNELTIDRLKQLIDHRKSSI